MPEFDLRPGADHTGEVDRRTCMSCDGPHAIAWSTTEGTAWLCPPCATLHGLGCP